MKKSLYVLILCTALVFIGGCATTNNHPYNSTILKPGDPMPPIRMAQEYFKYISVEREPREHQGKRWQRIDYADAATGKILYSLTFTLCNNLKSDKPFGIVQYQDVYENGILYLDNDPHDGIIDEVVPAYERMISEDAPNCDEIEI